MDLNQVKSLFTATDFERGMEYYRKGRVTDIQCTKAGTETNVTPDILEPIMAKATTYQADLRFPTKKPSLSAFLPAMYETVNRIMKYATIVIKIETGVMRSFII